MLTRGVVAAIAAGLVLAGAGPASAQAARSHRVTLITGDRVVLTVQADGTQSVTAEGSKSFHTVRRDGDVYAYPVELVPYLDRLLDRDLFNVTKLVDQGYGDRASGSIPLIVTHRPAERRLPEAVTRTATLESIDALAGRASKAWADEIGRALERQIEADAEGRPGPLASIESIHLDEKVRAALADSVRQIGAPAAWAAGFDGTGVDVAVLDSGADTTHPDLAGKVAAERNFTGEASPADLNGHGTHVAATVAGTGDGSAGLRKGVAPGARLLNGKVLEASGSGQVSWAIDAMEWAADNGAEIITMSLQAGFTDGTDPFAQAVNELTESEGVLFTIASGNFGSASQTVTTPGAASRALTVGAVDKVNVLAGFSGRGPRLGDYAIKPDVTAPGVDIVAARAAGTSLGQPVDALYTMLSGTSMATPHVAGAAAILKQEFPDWTPAQIKGALVSTAAPGPYTVYEHGGGRVDVARAYSQEVYASGPLDFGFFRWPHDDAEPVTKTITYSNESDAAVTLDLTVEVTPAVTGQVTPSATSVTVPAGGTATVDVTANPGLGDPGLYGGYVVGRSGDVVVRTPIGFYKEPESYDLTVEGIARDGRDAAGISWVEVVNADDTTAYQQTRGFTDGAATLRVPVGTYSVTGFLFTYDQPHVYALEAAIAGDPEVEVTADTTIVADARDATEVIADTERPTEVRSAAIGYYRAGQQRGSWESILLASPPISRFFGAPTEQVTRGDFGFRVKPSMAAPELEVDVTRPEPMRLDARYASGSLKLDGTEQRQLVYVGIGRPEDYQGRDVRGKAVLISRGTLTFADKVANATAAGAAAAVIHNNVPGLLLVGLSSSEIPVITTSLSQGLLLQDLLEDGPVRVRLRGIANSPYTYDVLFAERGRILPTHRRTVDRTNSLRINADYHADVDGYLGGEAHHAYPGWSRFSSDFARNRAMPFERTEYVAGADAWLRVFWSSMTNDCVFCGQMQAPVVSHPERGTLSQEWFTQPQRPGVIRNWEEGADDGQPVTRDGNTISGFVPEFEDPDGRFGFADSRTDTSDFRLYENGEVIAESTFGWRGDVTVANEPATYRAEMDVTRRAPWWRYSTDSETAWTFRSAPTSGAQSLPLLLVDYEVGRLDSLNRAPRGPYEIDLRVRRQQGAPAAAIDDARVWASFDDGGTWRRLDLDDLGGGNYTAALAHPARQTARHVSLRVQASDAGGSRISQTIMRAYGLE